MAITPSPRHPVMSVRLLPYAVADGPHNMAADEVLLEAAVAGVASLRFYGWSEPTVSLGYFQPHAARLPGLPWVRRPSGGMMLVHHHELTYCLALPAEAPRQGGETCLWCMHRIIADALSELSFTVRLHVPPEEHHAGPLCFRHFTAGDLLIGRAKVAGSAQRRQRGAIMQHGGILLAQSPFAPDLPGIHELTGRRLNVAETCAAIERAFSRATGWDLVPQSWSPAELQRIESLVAEKYGRAEWNEKR
jgi:lipoyl(octanoyl) transferase